jgi:hypothetical protein
MSVRAHVTSVEAIELFRATLINYLSKARPALEEVGDDLGRTRQWLQYDQRLHWENLLRRRAKDLEQAQQALFGAKLSTLREASTAEMEAVHRARRACAEAEEKLRRIKRWGREFETQVDPQARQLEKLRTVLFNDMVQAVHYLGQVVKTLDDYAGVAPPGAMAEPAPTAAAPAGEGNPAPAQPEAPAADAAPHSTGANP